MAGRGILVRLFKIEPGITLGQWLYDRITNNWAWLIAIFGGSGMSYLAAISDWIKPWGPIGWGGIGVSTALLCYLAVSASYFLYSRARLNAAIAFYTTTKATSAVVNVMAPVHTHEKIDLIQFYHPFMQPNDNVRFEDCHLMGPASIVMLGSTMTNSQFYECDVVIVRPDRIMQGASVFRYCTINRCKVFRVTFLMPIEFYNAFPDEMKRGLRIISDGRVGDI